MRALGSFPGLGARFAVALGCAVAVGCGGSIEARDAGHAGGRRPPTTCDALAAYAPWDGLPPHPKEESRPSRQKPAAPQGTSGPSYSIATLALNGLYFAERTERAEWRLQELGPVVGEGAEDVDALRASLHVSSAHIRSFIGLERDAGQFGLSQVASYRAYEDLLKACATRRGVPPCREVPDLKDAGWYEKLEAIANRRETVRVPALRAPLDRFAAAASASGPVLAHLREGMLRGGHAMMADDRAVDAAVDRLVARCGAPAPKPAEGAWVEAPQGTRPRDLVMVIKAESSPRLAARALTALRPTAAARALEATAAPVTFGSFGTGFLVVRASRGQERAYVITNRHVVAHGVTFELENDAGEKLPAADVIYEDRAADVAVLALQAVPKRRGGFVFAARPAHDGEPITLAGFPGLASRPTYQIVRGAVSNERLELEGVEYLQHTAPTDPGASGSPLLDSSGRVVGVAMGKAIGRDAASMAVPRHALLDALERALVVERLQGDSGYRREELVKACLSVVGSALDGHPVSTTRLSHHLVENAGPDVLAAALAREAANDDDDSLRVFADHDLLGAIDGALSVDVASRIVAAGPNRTEMCSGAHHAEDLAGAGPISVDIAALKKLSLTFVFERGTYKLADY